MRERQAYRAMFYFLKQRHDRIPSDDLSQLLSEMNLELWDDGEPADPAITAEWEDALQRVEGAESLVPRAEEPPLLKKAS